MRAFAIDAIELLGDRDAGALETDKRTHYAVVRAVEVLAEAASKIGADMRARHADLPWREAVGMRNVLIHGYQELDLSVVVQVVRQHLPPLVARLDQILGDEPK